MRGLWAADNRGFAACPVNLLAFDTSTEIMRIAVRAGDASVAYEAPGGALASAALIPAMQALLERAGIQVAQLDAIVFGRGPGSFTGLRTACSVAQGLAFGAGLKVLPLETLLAVAEDARERHGAQQVVAVLDARMDEVYHGRYEYRDGHWRRVGSITLVRPQDVQVPAGWVLAGNAAPVYGDRLPLSCAVEAAPTAAALLRLAPALLSTGHGGAATDATPLYIRDKVAQTTEERAAARAARQESP